MISAIEALTTLRQGNLRFVRGTAFSHDRISGHRRREIVPAQSPLAVILGCSDSRVPPEIVFDQGLGDLFVIRVAGNIVGPSQIGSVEYAVRKLGTRLVVVLGHSDCGVIHAAIDEVDRHEVPESDELRAIVEQTIPSVGPRDPADTNARGARAEHAVRAHIRASVYQLPLGSTIVDSLMRHDGLMLVGAEYLLESGLVEFFEGVSTAE